MYRILFIQVWCDYRIFTCAQLLIGAQVTMCRNSMCANDNCANSMCSKKHRPLLAFMIIEKFICKSQSTNNGHCRIRLDWRWRPTRSNTSNRRMRISGPTETAPTTTQGNILICRKFSGLFRSFKYKWYDIHWM